MAIAPNSFRLCAPLGFARRQAVVLHARPVALYPLRWTLGSQPLGCAHSQTIQGVAERLAHTLQPIEHANRRDDMRGVGALAAPRLEKLSLPTHPQKRLEEELVCAAANQASTKLT